MIASMHDDCSLRNRWALGRWKTTAVLGVSLWLGVTAAQAAVFTVTNLNDSGPGSLRQALTDAQNQPGADTVKFATNLSGDLAIVGTLELSGGVDLVGPGADVLTIYGNGSSHNVFWVKSGAQVTISGLSITNGRSGIHNDETLTVSECNIFRNFYHGIYAASGAILTVNDSTLSENSGDGIKNDGATITVNRSTIDGNSGAGIYSEGGVAQINDSTLSNNRNRGVISYYYYGTLRLNHCTIEGNSTAESGGGGGLYSSQDASLTIANSTFVDNTATSGCGGAINITKATDIDFYNNTLSGNLAKRGGGLCIERSMILNAFNSTITDNSANELGGGIYINEYENPTLMLGNSLVAGNSAPTGGYSPTAGFEIYNKGSFLSKGHNLFGQNGTSGLVNAKPAASDIILAGAIRTAIGPLANNGGPTKTHLLVARSPAINAGDNSLIPKGVTTDQRGQARIQNAKVDIGAVEVPAAPSTFKLSVSKVGNGTVTSTPRGINCGATCTASFNGGTTVKLTASPAAGYSFGGWSGACVGTAGCQFTMNAAKTVTATFNPSNAPDFRVTGILLTPASPAANSTFTAKVTVKNQGKVAGDGGYLDVWAHQPTAQACGAQGEWAVIGKLAAGASKTLTLTLRSKGRGAKTLRTFVDSWCETAEANEANNQSVKAYTVK